MWKATQKCVVPILLQAQSVWMLGSLVDRGKLLKYLLDKYSGISLCQIEMVQINNKLNGLCS